MQLTEAPAFRSVHARRTCTRSDPLMHYVAEFAFPCSHNIPESLSVSSRTAPIKAFSGAGNCCCSLMGLDPAVLIRPVHGKHTFTGTIFVMHWSAAFNLQQMTAIANHS